MSGLYISEHFFRSVVIWEAKTRPKDVEIFAQREGGAEWSTGAGNCVLLLIEEQRNRGHRT